MDYAVIAFRVLHVVTGVFWAGTILFVAAFLEPSVRAAGPAAAPVMQHLLKLRYFTIMPVVALLTLISGSWLYWKMSNGFDPAWMGSRAAMAYGTGGALSTVAFIIGVFVLRPITLKVLALGAQAQQAPPETRDAALAQAAVLRGRMKTTGRVIAVLLLLTVLAMAVARYL